MKELMTRGWSWSEDSAIRPTFQEILEEFSRSHFKVFPDVNSDLVRAYAEEIQASVPPDSPPQM
jgi:hypothetical protein